MATDILDGLTPQQAEAVTHVNGPRPVLAGADSGMARAATRRFECLMSPWAFSGSRLFRLAILAAMVLPGASACMANTVKGTVTDSTSGEVLANALVQEAGTDRVTLTDAQGRFALVANAAAGKGVLVVRKDGYATRSAAVPLGDVNLAIKLAREPETPGPSAALFANPFYVSLRNLYVAPPPLGNDANDGATPQTPWATLSRASSGRVAGDCVNLLPGTYKLTGEVTITAGGNASTPTGYVVYRSTVMGGAHLVAGAKFNHMIRIRTHHVMFDGLDFDGNDFMASLCGLDAEEGARFHHIWVMNSQVHGFGQTGIQENGSEWFWNLHNHVYRNACTVRIDWQGSGISHVVVAAVSDYPPTPMDDYWAPFHIVTAYNVIHDNCGQQGLLAGANTDGNGIIYDTFGSYAAQSLCLGNLVYHNGGKGIHVFKSGHVTVASNTAYNNNWDTYNPGTWRAEISAHDSVGSTFLNNIAWAVRGAGVTSTNAPFMGHGGSGNTWTRNIAYGAPNDFADSNAYPTPANKVNVDPLLVDVAKNDFGLRRGSPAIGFGTLRSYLPPQSIDAGACH